MATTSRATVQSRRHDTVHGAESSAHRETVSEDIASVVRYLVDLMGTKLVAHIADVDASTVRRWATTEQRMSDERERTLRATHTIARMLLQHDANHTVRAWFIGINPQLDDEAPADALREGRLHDVMASARAFLDGA